MISRNVDKLKKQHKIQKGKVTYSDLNKPGTPFFSKRYRITGKPDYVIKKGNRNIPVEFKTGRHDEPLKSHVLQLAAYCHLLEENYGAFVPYGILVYNNKFQYKISFDPKTRFELESTITKMRNLLKTQKIVRNHNDHFRCKSCSLSVYCEHRIL